MGKMIAVLLSALLLFVKIDGSSAQSESGVEVTKSPSPTLLRGIEESYVLDESAKGWLKLHRSPAAWADARLTCYDEGAELASPENQQLWIAMTKILQTSAQPPLRIYTGINDLYAKGIFRSVRGVPLPNMPVRWAPGEPDNIDFKFNCLVMQRNGMIVDAKCDEAFAYICYKRRPLRHEDLCGKDTEYVYDKGTKSCYKFHTQATMWEDGFATCIREGGHLAIVNSANEAQALKALFPPEWVIANIGFSYWRKDLWITIDGETLAEAGFAAWSSDEPNDYNIQRCGVIYNDGLLGDQSCQRFSGFICEKPALK